MRTGLGLGKGFFRRLLARGRKVWVRSLGGGDEEGVWDYFYWVACRL